MNNDDVIFENRYVETKDIVTEFHKYCVSGKRRKLGLASLLIGMLVIVVMMLLQVGVISIAQRYQAVLWEASIIFVFLGLVLSIYYRITASIAFRQDSKSMEGEIPEAIVQFTNEDVIISELGKVKNFHYRELGELVETKNLYVMMINKYAGIVVTKDGFTEGDQEDFKDFIESKYNDALPWKE